MSRDQATSGYAWLTARPIAHRGLHDAAHGVIENTPSAVSAAIAAGYAIEVDLQVTADGEAMVHHDAALGRLTDGAGRLGAMTAHALKQVPFKATSDRMLTVDELVDLVSGRVGLFLELKSHGDGDLRLPRRVTQVLASYPGPVAVMSFDPFLVHAIRDLAPHLPRGIVAERYRARSAPSRDGRAQDRYDRAQRRDSTARKFTYLLHAVRGRPHFLAYNIKDLPAPATLLARRVLALPLLTWTVRTEDDRQRAARFADQIIFEGFRPRANGNE